MGLPPDRQPGSPDTAPADAPGAGVHLAEELDAARRSERALRESEARQALLLALVARQREIDDPDRVMRDAAAAVGLHLHANRVGFFEMAGDATLRFGPCWTDGAVPPLEGTFPTAGIGARFLAALRAGRTLGIADAARDPLTADADLDRLGARSGICAPIIRNGRWCGGLYVHHATTRGWSEADVALVRAVADQTWDAVERARVVAELRRKSAELEEQDRRKDLFLATLGHELRNPLAALEIGVRLLREGKGDRANLEGALARDVEQLKALVNDLLEVSRITRGKLALRKAPVDLTAAVRAAIEAARPAAERRRQALHAELAEGVVVDADPIRLEQVAVNLLSNAAKFTPAHGTIRVALGLDGDTAVLTVSDTGRGIAPEELRNIFEPFTQVDPGSGGLGIGLPLARGLVELHGGTLTAESAGAGRGATFVARIPRGDPRRAASARAPTRARLPEALRVVVVDDQPDYADSLALLLRSEGCRATPLYSGEALLRSLGELQPHVVLLDLGLPGLSGYEVAERVRRDGAAPGAWLLAVTGYGDSRSARKAKAAGFDRRLVKPVDLEVLNELLRARVRQGL